MGLHGLQNFDVSGTGYDLCSFLPELFTYKYYSC